jgi:hypothetical protein
VKEYDMNGTIRSDASRTALTAAGWVSLVQGLLLLVPTAVLGAAIGWPESLGDPAQVALPRLLAEETAVRAGYLSYLLFSILFAVAVVLLARLSTGASMRARMALIVGFAVVSTLARSIGIIRWLVPMPQLATAWEAAGTDQERFAISVAFDVLNAFGGTIGEVLGVSIFASIALLLLCGAAARDGLFPRWLTVFGSVSAVALLATTGDLFGVDPGPLVVVGTSMVQFWFMAVGLWLLVRARSVRGIA